jgi:AraC-like DNA-binding protein
MFCAFDIYKHGQQRLRPPLRNIDRDGHKGTIYEMGAPEGLNFGYYKIDSTESGKVTIDNTTPFLQLSYTISGRTKYRLDGSSRDLAKFSKQEYNYVFLPGQKVHLKWDAGESLEIFELGISPELIRQNFPEDHAFYRAFHQLYEKDEAATLSKTNLTLRPKASAILYDMLHCPLEGRYKQLYLRGKTTELLAIQLEEYDQLHAVKARAPKDKGLKQLDIDRMYHARDIILSNLNSPCSLIDLAHQVGTNDAYLKKYFKEVFGNTVFGYLQSIKMEEARKRLQDGQPISEVAYFAGYKHVAHFTRAFKKHFGITPGQLLR